MMQNFLSSLRLQSGVRLDGVLLLSNFSSTRHSYPGLGRVSESNEDWIRTLTIERRRYPGRLSPHGHPSANVYAGIGCKPQNL